MIVQTNKAKDVEEINGKQPMGSEGLNRNAPRFLAVSKISSALFTEPTTAESLYVQSKDILYRHLVSTVGTSDSDKLCQLQWILNFRCPYRRSDTESHSTITEGSDSTLVSESATS